MPSLADLRMDSGRGMECRTMAPYSPYSAMTLLRPQHFSRFLHLALRFWNQTCRCRGTGQGGALRGPGPRPLPSPSPMSI